VLDSGFRRNDEQVATLPAQAGTTSASEPS